MTTPPPTAQDGEREKFSPWRSFDALWAFGSDADHALAITAPALSAELAALRAQVEGLRRVAEKAREFLSDSVQVIAQQSEDEAGGYASQWDCDADDIAAELSIALAQPQPVAKETKP
jgi:hypothetical protein